MRYRFDVTDYPQNGVAASPGMVAAGRDSRNLKKPIRSTRSANPPGELGAATL